MNDNPIDRDVRHAARVIALYRARRMGWLDGKTLQEIATPLGVNRSTIMRNIRDLDQVDQLAEEYLEALGPKIITKAPA